MDPFFALRSLATDIEHVVVQLPKLKQCLRDPRRSQPRAKYVLIVGKVAAGEKAVDVCVIAGLIQYGGSIAQSAHILLLYIVMQGILVAPLYAFLNGWI